MVCLPTRPQFCSLLHLFFVLFLFFDTVWLGLGKKKYFKEAMPQELEPTNRKVGELVPWLHTEVSLGKIHKMLLVALFHQRVCERGLA